jgi:putative inorganic carbon (hco3(-)) transporter
MVVMFLILAAPQFANDKGALALIVLGAIGLRMMGALLNGKESYRPSAIDGPVLLYFAVNLVASFASHYLTESIHGLSKLLVFILGYFLFVWCLQYQTKSRSLIALSSLILGALLVSVYGLYQYKMGVAPLATWDDPTIEDKTTRVFSTLGNPNLLAGYLIPVIPIGFCLSLITAFSSGRKRYLSNWSSPQRQLLPRPPG